MKRIYYFICLTVLLISSTAALSEVKFYEDLEDINAVSWPCDPNIGYVGADPDPNDPNSVAMWTYADPNNGTAVINNSVPGPFAGSNYLRLERISMAIAEDYGGRNMLIRSTSPLTGVVSLSFGFMVHSGDIHVTMYTSGHEGQEAVYLRLASGEIVYNYYGQFESTGLKFSRDEWHQIRIDANFNTQTYDLYLDGVKVTALAFYASDTGINRINISHAQIGLLYLDNIKIEIGDTECIAPMQADMNGDCYIDFFDFVRFAESWTKNNIQ